MKNKPSISIIVPCLNEEGNINGTIESIKQALATADRDGGNTPNGGNTPFGDFEILIFNDGSTDNTGKTAEEICRREKNVRVIHNPKNMGFGYNYTEGVRLASKDYTIMVPGDNEIPAEAITKIFSRVGTADIVIPYTANTTVRTPFRRVVSRAFVALINALFGLNLIYYNGTCVIKSSLLKKVPLKTYGFAYMAAILVRLIRSGASYVEVGVDIKPRATGASKAFALKNIVSVAKAILTLFWDVRIKDRGRYI